MTQKNIRQAFLDYFKRQHHTIVPSDSLVPSSDPTLLFTSAGMVQFKAHFLQQIPLTFTRAASSQRCLRTTDIERVGQTARHLTFFEMLGNFSFGDYFKEEAIAWAWEFLTKEVSLPKDRLWVSIFRDDNEAFEIWKKHVSENRIVRMGEKDNFWTMGPTGPCGPCSEIYFDKEGGPGSGPSETDDSDRYMEIWNNVFTQFDRQEDGTLKPLPKKNIDTGMGLERLASVVEGVNSNFDTSLLKPLIQFGEETFKYKYGSDPKKDISLRIVADHLRAVTFLVYDGILPANEGRGYVMRRLLRRATRQGAIFGKKEPFLFSGVPLVTNLMKETSSELVNRAGDIAVRIREEEERFLETLETGLQKFREFADKPENKSRKTMSGKDAFVLYSTYGFPVEVTKEMLSEQGMKLDETAFRKADEEARDMAREGWKGSGAKDVAIYNTLQKKWGASKFLGYETLTLKTPVLALVRNGASVDVLKAGEEGEVIAGQTPFYPEGGGQVGDKGWLQSAWGEKLADVLDAQKPINDFITHVVKAKKDVRVGETVEFVVDRLHREPTMRHHTATHLLHAALRTVLGKTVTQAGSLVAPEKLRFDYTYNKPLTPEQIRTIENIVNEAVLKNMKVTPTVVSIDVARKLGAMALFGEKYGDQVRTLLVSDEPLDKPEKAFSLELCGGTHCRASGDIGAFKIVSDSSIAAGVRRMEAVAGFKTLDFYRHIEDTIGSLSEKLKTSPEDVADRVSKLIEKQKQLEQEIRDMKLKMAQGAGASPSGPAVQNVNGVNLLVKVTDGLSVDELRTLVDRLKTQVKSGVIFAASWVQDEDKEKVSFVIAVTPDLKPKGLEAGKIAKSVAAEMGGSGGGRPDFAQGGGQGKDKLDDVVKKLPGLLK